MWPTWSGGRVVVVTNQIAPTEHAQKPISAVTKYVKVARTRGLTGLVRHVGHINDKSLNL